MEIDVTSNTNPQKNSFTLCHVEENFQNSSVLLSNNNLNSNIFYLVDKKDPLLTARNKKTTKNALRQQVKRRKHKKKTITSSNNSTALPCIVVKPLPAEIREEVTTVPPVSIKTPTMKEVLASIPGFTIKSRKRTGKKLSTAAQLEQTKAGCIDLETPDSILVNTNLRLLLNKGTFAFLPPLYQNKLVQLMPLVDRQLFNCSDNSANCTAISSGLNNEFFARACLDWQDRLAEGEFTPENQQKLKLDADKERSKLDPWKLKHFEPIWGDKILEDAEMIATSSILSRSLSRPPLKTTIKLRPSTTSASSKNKISSAPFKRLRTVGAMTRSCTILKEETVDPVKNFIYVPDVISIKQIRNKVQAEKMLKSQEVFIPESTKEDNEKKPFISDVLSVHEQDNFIGNISDAILTTNKDTIIIRRDIIVSDSEKRQHSLGSDNEENSAKRSKSMSPLELSPEPIDSLDTSELKDPLDITSEAVSDDKISEHRLEIVQPLEELLEKERTIDESSSLETNSTCSIAVHDLENISGCETMETTVDSLQLHINYNDDLNELNQVDNASSTSSALSTDTDHKSELESELPQDHDEAMTCNSDIFEIIPLESESCMHNLYSQENSASSLEVKDCASDLNENKQRYTVSSKNECMPEALLENNKNIKKTLLINSKQNISDSINQMDQQLQETFQMLPKMLPNTLILQQDSHQKNTHYAMENITENSAEKLEASVEEADLVISFDSAKIINDDDDANEDRFIDAENYVLESGQISASEKNEGKSEDVDIEATLFGDNLTNGAVDHDAVRGIILNDIFNEDQDNIDNNEIQFNLDNMTPINVKRKFRFEKDDIPMLLQLLRIPANIRTVSGHTCAGLEALCILLRRLAYPNRLSDLKSLFGRLVSALSEISNHMTAFIDENHSSLLQNLENLPWLNQERLHLYAQAITAKGAAVQNCWAFIDGTARAICRPTLNQEEYYSGHKRHHCVKYQSLVCPDGIIVSLKGAFPGRRHNAGIFRESGLYQQLESCAVFPDGNQYVIFGDQAYGIRNLLLCPYPGRGLNRDQQNFNGSMSAVRIAVEWGFQKTVAEFAFVDLKKKQKLMLQEVELMFRAAVILTNCHTCLYGSQCSPAFNVVN